MADSGGVWAKVYPDAMVLGNGRNLLYNGAMQVHQRGTSATGLTSGAPGYQTSDRWFFGPSVGTWTETVENDAPVGSGFRNSLKLLCETADASPAAEVGTTALQILEGQDLQGLKKGTASAETLTLSFWVKSNVTGTYAINCVDIDNTRAFSTPYQITSSGTWEKKTVSIPADTTGVLDNDNGASLRIQFWLAAGSDYTSGTYNSAWESLTNANRAAGQTNLAAAVGNYWQLTGVQLEVGETATTFEHKKFGQDQAECQRYYQGPRREFIGSQSADMQDMRWTSTCHTKMRETPTVQILDVTENCTVNVIHMNSSTVSFEVSAPGTSDFRPTWSWTAEAEL